MAQQFGQIVRAETALGWYAVYNGRDAKSKKR